MDEQMIADIAKAIWREDHYDPNLCGHYSTGVDGCAYCEPHDDDTPDARPADKERVERQARAAHSVIAGKVAELGAENAKLREALTPSGETKAAYIGEFKFPVEVSNDSSPETDYTDTLDITVPWTTIKKIMAAIRDRAALAPYPERRSE